MSRLNRYIDHTLLDPTASKKAIENLCREAIENNFKAVCVNSSYTGQVASLIKGENVRCAVTTGFPLGAMASKAKAAEAYLAMCQGADEIDMVLNLSWLKAAYFDKVAREIKMVKEVIGVSLLKVIIETAYLEEGEIVQASKVVEDAGADFVKTSTGFAPRGASIKDIELIKEAVNDRLGIKASGGIKTGNQALGLINAGATRIGTSNGIALMQTLP